ncbi:hypothetical protein [Saccharicrinis fermentans]|uniref:Uncharacterized protein n=1 Tax=Saccharicrinis fermentans DSM 9555 = JCM 21142 TaxID=869213 RepID=W7YBY8_9BACT|nr:hypothetical protein [Saccharicrinis fermentans]GAF05967.1 hypothetical protein JCM21142_134732 [Saccharicrinis fermentans DSM 9555 = JCM 21142]
MPYEIEELTLKNNLPEEQERTRAIFEDLKAKCIAGESLTEHEKDFFCTGVETSLLDDGKLSDYSCCNNYRFKTIYLTYFLDLSGQSVYQKPNKGNSRIVPPEETLRDINYLINNTKEWLKIIEKANHTSELLNQISKETRSQLKEIEKSRGKLLFRADKQRHLINRRKILLQAKYIYLMALQIFEMFDKTEFVLSLNGQDIELNEYSIIHILSRHFSEITKVTTDKSFHIEDFEPKYLNKQIGQIFNDIDNSGLFDGQPIDKIAFRYKGIDYLIWTKKKVKHVKGKGEVEYNRLETFYPVERQIDLQELNDNYSLQEVSAELSVYVRND